MLAEVFFQRAEPMMDDQGCWEWVGNHSPNGYARYGMTFAHRISHEIHTGKIPDGMEIDHLCQNRGCVNPAHLEAVTSQENMRRYSLRRTSCKQGHTLTPELTYINSEGTRKCRICTRVANRKSLALRRARKKADHS